MSRYNRALDLLKRGDIINKVDEVQPPPKYPFGDLLIKNDDEIRASTAAYRKKLETDNDITAQMSGVVRTKEKEKLLDDIGIGGSSPADLTLEKQLESQLTTSPLVPSDKVIEKVNTELLDKYIPKGNRLRYDVNKIDSIKQDMPEKELLYKKFEATGNPTLIKSIQEKGIQEPIEIVISKKLSKNNTASVGQMLLSDGHHRLEAAKQLNLTEVPVTVRVKETLDITDLKNDPNPVLLDTKGLKEGNYYKLSDLDLDKRVSFDSTSRIPTDLIYKNLATPKISNMDYQTKMSEFNTIEDISEWQTTVKDYVKTSREVNPDIRTPELEDSTRKLLDGNITREEHLKNIDEIKPVTSWNDLPREPSGKAVVFSLRKNQRADGVFALPSDEISKYNVSASELKVGDTFRGRLDIDAYKNYDSWVVAGDSSTANKGKTHYLTAIHYEGTANKPVKFLASQKTSERIGTGEIGKTGYARISGTVKDLNTNNIRVNAAEFLNNPEWTQVGFDPRRQGGFFVRAGENKHVPVREASEVIQIGPLVLAKNVVLDLAHKGYAKGGVIKKGLMSK